MRYWLILVAASLTACGGGGGSSGGNGEPAETAPTISDLVLAQDSVAFMEGGGRFVLEASVAVYDPDRNVSTVRVEISDGTSLTVDVPTPNPSEHGEFIGHIEISTETSGVYTAQVWVVDSTGRSSNRLNAEFTIFGGAALSDLQVNPVEFYIPFRPDLLSYIGAVGTEQTEVTVTAVLEDSHASFTNNGVPGASGVVSAPIALAVGNNEIIVSITADPGGEVRNYSVGIFRNLSSDSRLASLSITPGILDQAFDPDVTDYQAALSFLTSTVRITAAPKDENAVVRLTGRGLPSQFIDMVPYVASDPLPVPLQNGSIVIEVEVTAESGNTSVYAIEFGRQRPPLFATFTTIADSTTQVPGHSATFDSFETPAFDGTEVAFLGVSATDRGIYAGSAGAIRTIADYSTPQPPANNSTVGWFENPDIDNGVVVFPGVADGFAGIYTDNQESLLRVADQSTLMPPGTEAFRTLSGPTIDSGSVVFAGSGAGADANWGIYKSTGGVLDVVIDDSTVVPGGFGETFGFADHVSADSGNVLFRGRSEGDVQEGVYRFDGTTLGVVADRNSAVSDGTEFIRYFANVVSSGDNVAFRGMDTNDTPRFYISDGSTLGSILKPGDAKPLASEPFTKYSLQIMQSLALDEQSLVLEGGYGPLLYRDDLYTSILSEGDTIEGKAVSFVSFANNGLSNNRLAMSVAYDDLSNAIVVAEFDIDRFAPAGVYELDSNLDETNGGPSLMSLGGILFSKGYLFDENQGLVLDSLLSSESYSIEFVVKFDDPVARAKILDFANLSSDSGLYVEDGTLLFIDASTPRRVDANDMVRIEAGINVHVLISRDAATGELVVYVDGHERIRFIDSAAQGVFLSSVANLFVDDSVTLNEASSGFVHYIRIYNMVVSQDQVSFLARGLSDCVLDGCLPMP